jgi:hypothetical protein
MYQADMEERLGPGETLDILKPDSFAKVWRIHYSKTSYHQRGTLWVKMTKVEAGKCDICKTALAAMRSGDMATKKKHRVAFRDHLKFIAQERAAYVMNRERAERGEAISVGADATASYATVRSSQSLVHCIERFDSLLMT